MLRAKTDRCQGWKERKRGVCIPCETIVSHYFLILNHIGFMPKHKQHNSDLVQHGCTHILFYKRKVEDRQAAVAAGALLKCQTLNPCGGMLLNVLWFFGEGEWGVSLIYHPLRPLSFITSLATRFKPALKWPLLFHLGNSIIGWGTRGKEAWG